MKLVRSTEPTRVHATRRSRFEEASEARDFPFAFGRMLARTLAPLLNEEEAIAAIGQLAIGDLAHACWVHLVGEDGELRLAASWECDDAPSLPLPAAYEARLTTVLHTRQPDSTEQEAARTFLIIPLALGQNISGTMTFAFLESSSPPGSIKAAMAEDLAVHAAAAIERSRVHACALNALSSRDDSFAAAAHELGNPLNALLLQVQTVTHATSLEPSAMARIFAMERLIKRLADLNRRMLDSSRLAAGQFELRLEDVDLTALVQEVLANNAEQLAWSKCAASLSSPGPVVGRWDRRRLEQVVSNLIGNAMKFGHGESISVSVEATANLARLSVRDHGIGIGAKDHDRIFDRFERAAPVGASTSLGLGLWVVRQIVSALHGTVQVESRLGGGATFTVELPRAASNVEAG